MKNGKVFLLQLFSWKHFAVGSHIYIISKFVSTEIANLSLTKLMYYKNDCIQKKFYKSIALNRLLWIQIEIFANQKLFSIENSVWVINQEKFELELFIWIIIQENHNNGYF